MNSVLWNPQILWTRGPDPNLIKLLLFYIWFYLNKIALLIRKKKKMAIQFNHLILEVQKSKFVTGIGLVCTNPPSTQPIIPNAASTAHISFGSCFWDGSRSMAPRNFTPTHGRVQHGLQHSVPVHLKNRAEHLPWSEQTVQVSPFPECIMGP